MKPERWQRIEQLYHSSLGLRTPDGHRITCGELIEASR